MGRETIYPQMAQMAQMRITADCGDSGGRDPWIGERGELSADGADDADGTEGSVGFGTFLGDPAEGVSWAAAEVLSLLGICVIGVIGGCL